MRILIGLVLLLCGCSLSPSADFLKALGADGAGVCVAAGVQTPVPYAGTAGFDAARLNQPGKVTLTKDGSCTIEIFAPQLPSSSGAPLILNVPVTQPTNK